MPSISGSRTTLEPFGRLTRYAGPTGAALVPETDWLYVAGQVVAALKYTTPEPVGNTLRVTRAGSAVSLRWGAPNACEVYKVQRSTDPDFSPASTLADGVQGVTYVDTPSAAGGVVYQYVVDSSPNTRLQYLIADRRGSTVAVLDEQGTIVAEYEYFPFGSFKLRSGCEGHEGLYQSSLRDGNADIFDLGVRHHSPAMARFLVPDVIQPALADPSQWNLYMYSRNDPANLVDPDGRQSAGPESRAVAAALRNMTPTQRDGYLEAERRSVPARAGVAAVVMAPFATVWAADAVTVAGGAYLLNAPQITNIIAAANGLGPVRGPADGIRFSQQGVSEVFRHGDFARQRVVDIAAGLRSGAISPDQLPIQVVVRDGIQYAMNNRSLLALRLAGMSPTVVRNVTGNPAFERQLTERLAEFVSTEAFAPVIRSGGGQ